MERGAAEGGQASGRGGRWACLGTHSAQHASMRKASGRAPRTHRCAGERQGASAARRGAAPSGPPPRGGEPRPPAAATFGPALKREALGPRRLHGLADERVPVHVPGLGTEAQALRVAGARERGTRLASAGIGAAQGRWWCVLRRPPPRLSPAPAGPPLACMCTQSMAGIAAHSATPAPVCACSEACAHTGGWQLDDDGARARVQGGERDGCGRGSWRPRPLAAPRPLLQPQLRLLAP